MIRLALALVIVFGSLTNLAAADSGRNAPSRVEQTDGHPTPFQAIIAQVSLTEAVHFYLHGIYSLSAPLGKFCAAQVGGDCLRSRLTQTADPAHLPHTLAAQHVLLRI
ncbi:MAG TPA: hypothetical protein VHE81_01855 [Lacipirellulaceae bacterium]|nr:hypothetical protein [Lacipirellulaceae bacterium]